MAVALDGAGAQTNTFSIAYSGTVGPLTVDDADELIVVVITCEANGSVPYAESVTAGAVTFTNYSQTTIACGAGIYNAVEIWWAAPSGTFSDTITVDYNTGGQEPDDVCLVAFGVTGADNASPWDTNGSLPANTGASGTNTVSTDTADDLILSIGANCVYQSFGSPTPGSLTNIAIAANGGGANDESVTVDGYVASGTLSSLAVGYGTTPAATFFQVVTAAVVPEAGAPPVYAYVLNLADASISQIDTSTNTVTATWTGLGLTNPYSCAVSPDGSVLMVSGIAGDVYFIDTGSATVLHTTVVGGTLQSSALSADGSVYVVPITYGALASLDTATYAVLGTATVPDSPAGACVTPDNSTAYVCGDPSSSIYVVDLSSHTVTDTITGLETAVCLAITPDGTKVLVPGRNTGTVYEIDTGSNTVTNTVAASADCQYIAISPDGSTAYISVSGGHVDVLDIASFTITHTIAVGSGPVQLAVTPDGTQCYVSNNAAADVSPIDTGTDTAGTAIAVGTQPYGIGIEAPPASTPVNFDGTLDIEYDMAGDMTLGAVSFEGTESIVYDYEGDLTISPPVFLEGTEDIVYDYTGDLTISPTVELEGTESIEYTMTGDLTLMSLPEKTVTTMVLAGDPGPTGYSCVLVPTPPNPQPGNYGNHDYEVLVCDIYGVGMGVIPSAVPTQIDYDLDDIGQCLFDFAIDDQLGQILLPPSVFPGVREIQIWRDQVCIWWGWPISCTFDASQVHVTCAGLLWVLGQREIGPEILHYVTNPQFESGLADWTAVGCFAGAVSNPVVLGDQAARLVCGAQGEDAYLHQSVVVDLSDQPSGVAFAVSAYVYLDGNYDFTGPALDSRGLFMSDQDGNFSFVTIDTGFTPNTWTRLEIQPSSPDPPDPAFIAPAGVVTTYDLRLYCPGGSVVWDAVVMKAYENVSAPPASPPAVDWNVTGIMKALINSAQAYVWGKSYLAFGFYGPNTAVRLNRVYQVPDSEVLLDALNEFPTIGVCDFEMVWDQTGHFRGFQVFPPAKGAIQYNYPINVEFNETTDLQGQVDGSQVGTTQRIFGQGSSGPARDAGYAQFASYLGGRVVYDAGFVSGSDTVASGTADFTDADLNVNIYSLNGALYPSTYITEIIDSSHARFNNTALLTINGETFGVGGVVIDASQSALPNQPISTLQGSAEGFLTQQMKPMVMLSSKMRADGPNGLFGRITVGDVLPVSADYGWLQIDPPVLMRSSKLTLYPPTEELEVTLMPVGSAVSLDG